jgi:hopanoid C-3 methylase
MKRVLLVRPRYRGPVSRFGLIRTEPLELEYLASVCSEEGVAHRYYDGMVQSSGFKAVLIDYAPDLVAISGYITAQDTILHYAGLVHTRCPNTHVIVGGPHAEINPTVFQTNTIDYVVHSDGIETFRRILRDDKSDRPVDGAFKKLSNGRWVKGSTCKMDPQSLPIPDRTHFLNFQSKFYYMDYGPVALVKRGYGCPHVCPFCYCRLLNQGRYTARSMDRFIADITDIEASVIWITDDCFTISMETTKAFCHAVTQHCPDKRFIIYSRADFIADHPEVIPQLRKAGIIEVIVGFEAVTEEDLARLGKGSPVQSGRQCATLLAQAGIRCTGLFMVTPDDPKHVFWTLNQWIHTMDLHAATLSVLTPIPGTALYEQYQHRLTTTDCRKWDLMHLVMKTTHMSRLMFYVRLYSFYMKQLLRRPWQWRLVPKILLRRFRVHTEVWDFWAKHYERLWVQRISLGPTRLRVIEQITLALETTRREKRPLRILDMGCGTGQLIRDIHAVFPSDRIHCTGVDRSAAMIALAKERDAQGCYLVSDVNDFACEKPFDVVCCCHSFPYYADQPKTLDMFKALLKPGGMLLLAQASPKTLYDRIVMRFVKLTTSAASYPSPDEMRALACPIYGIPSEIPINESPLVPTILLYCWRLGS